MRVHKFLISLELHLKLVELATEMFYLLSDTHQLQVIHYEQWNYYTSSFTLIKVLIFFFRIKAYRNFCVITNGHQHSRIYILFLAKHLQ